MLVFYNFCGVETNNQSNLYAYRRLAAVSDTLIAVIRVSEILASVVIRTVVTKDHPCRINISQWIYSVHTHTGSSSAGW